MNGVAKLEQVMDSMGFTNLSIGDYAVITKIPDTVTKTLLGAIVRKVFNPSADKYGTTDICCIISGDFNALLTKPEQFRYTRLRKGDRVILDVE